MQAAKTHQIWILKYPGTKKEAQKALDTYLVQKTALPKESSLPKAKLIESEKAQLYGVSRYSKYFFRLDPPLTADQKFGYWEDFAYEVNALHDFDLKKTTQKGSKVESDDGEEKIIKKRKIEQTLSENMINEPESAGSIETYTEPGAKIEEKSEIVSEGQSKKINSPLRFFKTFPDREQLLSTARKGNNLLQKLFYSLKKKVILNKKE